MKVIDIDIENVLQFSNKDRDYLLNTDRFSSLIKYKFDSSEFPTLINDRKSFQTDRKLLVEVIKDQYTSLNTSEKTKKHIESLLDDNTFTITTAHQPNLFTGPLYSIYKILSVINLSEKLTQENSGSKIVPVFVMGSEDHDFEEINHLRLFKKKIEWSTEQSGSVGHFSLVGIKDVIDQVSEILGDNPKTDKLIEALHSYEQSSSNYAEFAFKLFHYLFDRLGLVILNMDDKRLKGQFTEILQSEITSSASAPFVRSAQEHIKGLGHEPQTYIRDINVFYRHGHSRDRIERDGDTYQVIGTDLSFSEDDIKTEISEHPERFSPNVIMRPLYQELILPNLAYVGGGGEISYWLERKTQFEHFGLPFPMLIRRTSAMIGTESALQKFTDMGFADSDLFKENADLVKQFLEISDSPDYSLSAFKKKTQELYSELDSYISGVDKSLSSSTKSEMVKSIKSLDYLSSKLKKSIKQKEEVKLNRIEKFRSSLLPDNGLQERKNNILEYISMYGEEIIDKMLPHCNPMDKKMKFFLMQPEDR